MSDDGMSVIEQAELEIAGLVPTAADMIATVMEEQPTTFDTYAGLMELASQESPLLLCALVRFAAGLATIAECTPEHVRALPAAIGGKVPKSLQV